MPLQSAIKVFVPFKPETVTIPRPEPANPSPRQTFELSDQFLIIFSCPPVVMYENHRNEKCLIWDLMGKAIDGVGKMNRVRQRIDAEDPCA